MSARVWFGGVVLAAAAGAGGCAGSGVEGEAPSIAPPRQPATTTADAGRDHAGGSDTSGARADAGAASPLTGGSDGGAPAPSPPPRLCAIALDCDREIPDGEKLLCRMSVTDGTGAPVYADHAGVELRGRSSLHFPKKSYSVELRTGAGATHPVDLLGMGHEADWVLDGSWVDRSFMRNALVFDAFRALGPSRYAPEGRFCTLALDGEPRGIYRLVEKIKRDASRLDVAADDGNGGSFIIKQDEDGAVRMPLGLESRWKVIYPNQETATPAQLAGVQAWLDGLRAALAAARGGDARAAVFSYLDLDATVDWLLFQELSKNIDAYNLSVHLARSGGGAAQPILWDLDLSFGQPTVRAEAAARNDAPSGWITHRTDFVEALSAIPDLRERLGPRWRALRTGPLATQALLDRVAGYGVTLEDAALAQNFAIWPLGDVDFQFVYDPYTLYPVASYADEVAKLRAFLQARLSWIDASIDGYPGSGRAAP